MAPKAKKANLHQDIPYLTTPGYFLYLLEYPFEQMHHQWEGNMASLGEKALDALGVLYTSHEYDYRKKGAEAAAEALDVPLSATLKTLVVALPDKEFVFLMAPGDCSVSMRNLARTLQVKQADLASERDAQRLTGYQVGGIGPFGSRTTLPVYIDLKALDHDKVYFNGGRRGLILGIETETLLEAAQAELVDVCQR